MATTYKVLGQGIPAAGSTQYTLYTVPAATQAIVSTISICNENATAITYRISVRVAAAADATKQYIAYDVSLPANTTDTLTLGITLAATDVITVYCSSTAVAFNAYGSEIS